MPINPNIFRAYDVRGVYPDELSCEAVYLIMKAYCQLFPDAKKVVLAQDPRLSSPDLAKSAIKALIEEGREIIDIGIAPDPLFYFAIFHQKYDGGLMISGSHNPKEYNGLTLNARKASQSDPEDVIGEDLEKIKEMVEQGQAAGEKPDKEGSLKKIDVSADYVDYVASKIKLAGPLKIIIDTGNGAAGLLPEKIFKKLGCQAQTLYPEFDGSFPNHLPDPYEEENLKDIKAKVLAENADIGFAFDTDADRVAPIDNQGRMVKGDFCLFMLAKQALKKKKGPIAHCMRVSKAFLDEMKKQGVKTHFCVSHHSAVAEKIIEKKCVFGGEITLHFLFPLDYYLCDEAIFSSLKLAEIASEHQDFAKHIDTLPRYHSSIEVFIETPDEEKFQIIEELQKYLKENNYDFIGVDGARIQFPNGWALARAANTSPFIKCRFEGHTKQDLMEIQKKSLAIFKAVGIPLTKKNHQELGLEEI